MGFWLGVMLRSSIFWTNFDKFLDRTETVMLAYQICPEMSQIRKVHSFWCFDFCNLFGFFGKFYI
jgi:hypothetical protein